MRTIPALLLLCSTFAAADTVVLRDRTVVQGAVTRGAKALSINGRAAPLDDVLLWESGAGTAQYSAGLDDLLAGYATLARRDLLQACRAQFPKAVEAGAKDSASAILAQAIRIGLPNDEAAAWTKEVRSLTATKDAKVKVPGGDVFATLMAKRAQVALDNDEQLRGWQILREAFRYDRDNEAALQILEDIAPERWKLGHFEKDNKDEYRVQRLWLNWQVDVLQGEVRAIGRLHPDMQRARARWRKDLNGLETREEAAEIVFATPINDKTEMIGKCVRYAKITCRALGKMFKVEKPRREDNIPLVIYFYENKTEYVRLGSGRPNPFLAMTAGFYTPGENISRFFWPDRPDATRAVRDTFVHELTHHWIERRNPRWHASDLVSVQHRTTVPGYWIGEGFATFIEEGIYDIENYTWKHFNPKANSIDIVAALAKDGKLIDWEKQYTLTQAEFHNSDSLQKKGVFATAKKRWGMRPQPLNEIRLFYEQAATTCHFLYWADGGKYRERLLEYVTSFYTSKKEKTSIQAAFGMSEAELGKKVEEWARKVVYEGWRPREP